MADPVSLATMAMGGMNMLGGLLGKGGGGGGGSITKQDNYQNTTLNVSVGSGFDSGAFRSFSPFPGAMSANFATPVGFSGGAAPMGSGILDTISRNALPIALAIGAFVLFKKLG